MCRVRSGPVNTAFVMGNIGTAKKQKFFINNTSTSSYLIFILKRKSQQLSLNLSQNCQSCKTATVKTGLLNLFII